MAISLKHNFTSAVADEGDTSLVRPSNWNAEHDLTLATSRLVGRTTAGTGSAEEISVGTGLNLSSGSLAVSSTTPQVNSINTFTVAQVIETTDNSNPALRITQLGTADALRIEDETSPDSTPFVVTAAGHAIAGYGSALAIQTVVPQFQSHTATLDEGGFGGVDWGNTATGQVNWFGKSRGGSYGVQTIVQSGDVVGDTRFYGSDGVGLIPTAKIEVAIDGTPGVNDMPGRISMYTTADGASSVSERMRITSAGNVGIGTTAPSGRLEVLGGVVNTISNLGTGDAASLVITNSDVSGLGRISKTLYEIGNLPVAAIAAVYSAFNAGGDIGGDLVFGTQTNLAGGVVERLRISNAGVSTFTGTGIINANSSTDALRITQAGAGNAILVEDSANPDSTPFVVTAAGNVGIGLTNPSVQLQVVGTAQNRLWLGSAATTNRQLFVRSNGTFAVPTIVSSGDAVGSANFFGYDGAANIELASIVAAVDGTPGTSDMPGRLTFSTTADGAAAPTERLRIGNAGQLGIGGANYGTSGQALLSGGSGAAPTWGNPAASAASGMFWENDLTLTTDYTITTNKNAGTFGPVTINSGVTVTVPSGSTWTIV